MTRNNPETDLVVSASGTSVVPSRRKAGAKTRAKHSAVAAEPSVSEPEVPQPELAKPEVTRPEATKPQAVAKKTVSGPAREEIAELAYLYWEARGCQGGSPEEDWIRAEQELRLRTRAVTA